MIVIEDSSIHFGNKPSNTIHTRYQISMYKHVELNKYVFSKLHEHCMLQHNVECKSEMGGFLPFPNTLAFLESEGTDKYFHDIVSWMLLLWMLDLLLFWMTLKLWIPTMLMVIPVPIEWVVLLDAKITKIRNSPIYSIQSSLGVGLFSKPIIGLS